VARYGEVVAALVGDGHTVVLSGGPAAADRAKVAALAAASPSPRLIDACGRLDFGQLAGLLSRAALYIGPDTSVTHLAAASGVAAVALFGPTDPTRWGPIGSDPGAGPFVRVAQDRQQRGNVVLLQGPGACVPCGRAGCLDHHDSASACLEELEPQRVLAEARRLLEADRDPARRPGVALSRAAPTGA
jgi:heptosyltransferase-3